ncbi:hypothetical protein LTR53_003442 [Teratosphaeriaceae sp. CCFEE 6253]|nr:hypothetical protein LTR53_003442 [Teratosphaeriaceae sp. CCFEE 6253]
MPLIDDLLDLQVPQSVQLSPNGQLVLWSTAFTWGQKNGEHAVSTLWLAETGKQHSARQLTPGDHNDHDPKWSPDGQSIAFISDRAKQSESSAIYLMPVSGSGEAVPLTLAAHERGIASFAFSPDAKTIAYLSVDEKTEAQKTREKEKDDAQVWGEDWPFNRLRVIDVSTKEETLVYSPEAHVADFAFSDDGSKIAFTQVETPHIESAYLSGTDFYVMDVQMAQPSKLSRFPKHHYGSSIVWAGDYLYFLGPRAETIITSSSTVFRLKVGSGETKYERYAYGETNCAFDLAKAGGDVVLRVEDGMQDQLRILNGNTLFSKKKAILAWDAAFPKDSDEVILAIAQGDADHPTEVFTTTASGGALIQLSSHGKSLADHRFGICTFLTCPTTDQKYTLECPWLAPASAATNRDGTPKSPLPTIVMIHGGPYYRHSEKFDGLYFMWVPYLLAAGYAILMADYRGSSGRGEEWAAYAYGRNGGGGGKEDYDDIIAQTQAAIEKGWADKDRLVVCGYSQGGFLSYLASVRNGNHGLGWGFKASIPGAGVTDFDAMTMTSDIGFWQAEEGAGAPWELSKSDTRSRSSSAIWEFADQLKHGELPIPPMLILHGEKDVRVPIEQAVGMRRAMMSKGLVFEYVTYPREGHQIVERKHLVDMATRIKAWVEKYIGPA